MEQNSFKTIYLIRHCKAEGQEAEAKLTAEGEEQAHKLAGFLYTKQIDFIISSSYARAVASIKPLAEKINLEVHTDDRLYERILSSENFSDWETKLHDSFLDKNLKLPGGESSAEAIRRGISVIEELLVKPEKTIAVITHGNLLSLILHHYNSNFGFQDWKSMSNPDVFEFLIPANNDAISVKRIWM